MINKYKCPKCNNILERESTKKWIKSYCSESGEDVRLQLISEVHNNMHGFLLDFIIATKEQMHSKKVVTLGEFIIEFISNNSIKKNEK